MSTPTSYNAYAAIYDATGQSQAGAASAAVLLRWLAASGHLPRTALELGCGTGAVALALAAAGIRVTGVDRAPAMLAIAAGRVRDAGYDVALIEADLGALELPAPSFDLVTCCGVVNELDRDGDLARLFEHAAGWLRPGGYLAFDLLTPGFFQARQDADHVLHDGPDHMLAAQLLTDDDGQVWGRRVLWFVREIDRWWRGEELQPLRAWSETAALDALQQAGFAPAIKLPHPDRERTLFAAQR
jgi:SAM-dependent methyltransferase